MSNGESSFVVTVLSNENNTWQGVIQWINTNKKQSFRSALEMLKLIDSAVSAEQDKEEK